MLKSKVSDLGTQIEIYLSTMAKKWKLKHGKLLWKVQRLCNNLEEKNCLCKRDMRHNKPRISEFSSAKESIKDETGI